ncbi:MAG TPA: hypothetical protein VMB04_26435 [Mycobacterium sp.]|nr:hypothetical protein [Mycobacterium sp.]
MTTDRSSAPTDARRPARSRRWSWLAVLVAALVAAVADAAFAFVAYVLIAGRFNFETLLQYIASGVLGDAAFATGWVGIGTATLGFAIHAALAVVYTAFYAVVISPRVHTLATASVLGVAYGAGIWVFMNAVVLPLGRAAREPFLGGYYLAFWVDHALLLGLPIALILYAWAPRRSGD